MRMFKPKIILKAAESNVSKMGIRPTTRRGNRH